VHYCVHKMRVQSFTLKELTGGEKNVQPDFWPLA